MSVDQQSGKPTKTIVVQFLIPILLLVCLFSLFTRVGADGGAGGIAAFSEFTGKGRKKGKGTRDRITFADVAGAGEALAELREIRDYLADPSKYLAVGAAAPKGVLLVGPPGTGKTLLAKAVAGEADAAFFSVSGSDFVESLVGVGAARVRDLFRKARKASPAIIFIDELDAAGRKRGAGIGQGNDEREQTLNQILVEMDGFAGDGGLVVMGATNRPDILDPALLRPGRFDRQVVVDTPDVHGRLEILRLHGGKRPLAPDASLEEVARQTPGFSGAELANVINEAALLSVRDGRGQIDQATLEEAIDRVVAGPAKRHILTEQERWLIAIHEASHAVVTDALGHTTSTRKLSIVARGRQLGTAAHMLSDRDQVIMTKPDLQSQLIVITAGLAGERIAFGHTSTTRQRRPARRDGARAQHGHLVRHVRGARPRDDRREGRRGVPRRLAAGPRLGRPGDAEPDRQRGRAARRRRRGARRGRSSTATGAPSRRPRPRCSSRRRSRASRSTRCSRRSRRSRSRSCATCAGPRRVRDPQASLMSGVSARDRRARIRPTALAGDARRADRARVLDDRARRRRPPRGRERRRRPSGQRQAARRRAAAARARTGSSPPRRSRRCATPRASPARPPSSSPAPARRQTVDLGTWCLDTAPYPLTNAEAGKNNYIWASKACEAEGGWLPDAPPS